MIRKKLEKHIARKATLLGVGPMSTNCIDAAAELANEYDVPIMLIASRRQIDCEESGGGYVNNWTTEEFARYVMDKNSNKNIILCRDHGGPWQYSMEIQKNLDLKSAMKAAKISYQRDIEAGFNIIHIDPSIDIHSKITPEEITDRVLELYEFCWDVAQKLGCEIEFEIGTEDQSEITSSSQEVEKMLSRVNKHCKKYKMPRPLFVVVPSGTKVIETQNVGSFSNPFSLAEEVIQIPIMSKMCLKNMSYMKVHNSDYLSDEALQLYPSLGIHAANIAPEYGVKETSTFINLLKQNECDELADEFLNISYASQKWEKWMKTNTISSKFEKSIIAGHYVFSNDEFKEIMEKASNILSRKNININLELKEAVKDSILSDMKLLRMII